MNIIRILPIMTILVVCLCCPAFGFNDKIIEYFSDDVKFCNLAQNETHINITCNVIVGFSSIEKNSTENKPICFSNTRSRYFSLEKINLMDKESRKIIFAMNFLNNTEFHEIQLDAAINTNDNECTENESIEIISNIGNISCYVWTYPENKSDCIYVTSKKNHRYSDVKAEEITKQDYSSRTGNSSIELGKYLDHTNLSEENTTNETIWFDKDISTDTGKQSNEKKQDFTLLIVFLCAIVISIVIFVFTRH